jgi:Flp pilus assembly protein TadD
MNHSNKHPFRRTAEQTLLALGLGGGLVAGVAMIWPAPSQNAAAEVRAIAPEDEAPEVIVDTVSEPIMTAELPETSVEGTRPLVAVAHEDRETDYEALAKAQIEEGDLRAAFESLRKHLYDHEPTPELLHQIGRVGAQLKEHAVAEQALLDAAGLDPKNAEIQIERGRVLLEMGEIAEARAAARQAIRLDRDNASAWNLAGRVAMAESQWHRAETALRAAVELEPTDPMLHNNLGLLYVYMKRGADAVDSLETSMELYDEEIPYFVHNNLGLAYELAGRLEDARDAFSRAVVENPDYSRAQVNLQRMMAAIAKQEQDEANASRTAELEPEAALEGDDGEIEPESPEIEEDEPFAETF